MGQSRSTDTPHGTTAGGGGKTGPSPELQQRVVSGDRNTGTMDNKPARHPKHGEEPRDKPTEEEADRDVKEGAEGALEEAKTPRTAERVR